MYKSIETHVNGPTLRDLLKFWILYFGRNSFGILRIQDFSGFLGFFQDLSEFISDFSNDLSWGGNKHNKKRNNEANFNSWHSFCPICSSSCGILCSKRACKSSPQHWTTTIVAWITVWTSDLNSLYNNSQNLNLKTSVIIFCPFERKIKGILKLVCSDIYILYLVKVKLERLVHQA